MTVTTDGKVRNGVLDDMKAKAAMVLNKELPSSTMFPFICKIDDKSDADDPEMWVKAIPSLPYNPTLKNEIRKQYENIQTNDRLYMSFYCKRMNFPLDDIFNQIATDADVKATDRPLPEFPGRVEAIGGVDFADKRDFCAVGLLIKHGGIRCFLHHSFVFKDAIALQGINREIIDIGVRDGFITLVDNGKEIPTELVVEWFKKQSEKFNIKKIACDDYRSTILKHQFKEAGLLIETVRRGHITHSRFAPLIQEMFVNQTIVFPGDAVMRWYIFNVYKHQLSNGNTEFEKIDKKKRKTDGFFAFLHALSFDEELNEYTPYVPGMFKVYSY